MSCVHRYTQFSYILTRASGHTNNAHTHTHTHWYINDGWRCNVVLAIFSLAFSHIILYACQLPPYGIHTHTYAHTHTHKRILFLVLNAFFVHSFQRLVKVFSLTLRPDYTCFAITMRLGSRFFFHIPKKKRRRKSIQNRQRSGEGQYFYLKTCFLNLMVVLTHFGPILHMYNIY